MINFLRGKKTYIFGVLSIIYAITGMCLGKISLTDGFTMIQVAVTGMCIRAGIKN